MNSIPVDCTRLGAVFVTGVEPATDNEGKQRVNVAGISLWKIECLVRPLDRPDGSKVRASVELISVPSSTPPKIPEMTPVTFDGLMARHWNMDGRSGVSFSADSVRRQSGE